MRILSALLPFLSLAVSLAATILILRRFALRRAPHHLVWGLGALMYGVGSACEALYGVLGWSPLCFRLWYLFGAMLVAAWLGQGTVYLVARRGVAHALGLLLAAASVYGAIRVAGAVLDPALMPRAASGAAELSGRAIVSAGVRVLTPFFNTYGTLALVGGAIWTAVRFLRKGILRNRVVASVLVAVGAILPALGGASSRLGIPYALYGCELAGILLILLGFLRGTADTTQRP